MIPGQTNTKGVRSFVAVPLPAALQASVLSTARSLSAQLPAIKWSHKAENLHVTLAFLGQVDGELLSRFTGALGQAVGGHPRFEILLRGVGAFPSVRNAQVVWIGIEDRLRRLDELARVVGELAERLSVGDGELRRRPFSAHVTIGRTPRRRGSAESSAGDVTAALAPWADRSFGAVSVEEIHVYESITGGDASTYVLRGKAMLEGATHGDGKERDQGSN
jgi:2'-5' RNA ligase